MMLPFDQVALRLLVSLLLSSLVGWERESRHKPSGLRTNILVGVGSTLIMLISLSFDDGPSRIASQAVTGIGFLGAGLIIQSRGEIHGITTAASIWLVSAVGLAVGLGYYTAAVSATLLALAVLYFFGNEKLRRVLRLDR